MRALVFESLGRAALRDMPDPQPGHGEVLVKVAATGICHTDTDILAGRYLAAYPVVPGHEFAGTIIGLGAGVEASLLQARVAIDPLLPCGDCPACREGRYNLCASLAAYGATCNGAFAPLAVVRAANAHPIGDLPFDVAALAEPFSCVLHGVGQAHVRAGSRCLIFGAGPIGLMMMLALQTDKNADVTMADILPDRREAAASLGAQQALDANSLAPETLGERFDLVVDCTGVPAVCATLTGYARDAGTVLFFGVCPPGATIALSPNEVFRRELRIVGSHSLCGELPHALDCLRRLGPRAHALISHHLDLDEIATCFGQSRPQRAMKIQYRPDP